MIKQFIEELVELEKKYYHTNSRHPTYKPLSQIIQDTIKIFYDYCLETDNPLSIALKFMIDNNKRPRYYQNDNFYWFKSSGNFNAYHWLEEKLMYKILFTRNYKHEFIDSYENCLLALKEVL